MKSLFRVFITIRYQRHIAEALSLKQIGVANSVVYIYCLMLTCSARHEQMVGLVRRMLDLHKQLAAEGNPQVRTVLQRQVEAMDGRIDGLVYELYGLTDEEIAIVEGRVQT
jgi:hypothetical protein